MKLRELLKKLRLRQLQGGPPKLEDSTDDALAAGTTWGGASAPPNWVPSQQDERPH
jgi:hypothetical protein